MLVDSHCHLDFPDYAGKVDAVVERARAAGVGVCVTIGTELARFPGVRAVAETHFPMSGAAWACIRMKRKRNCWTMPRR